MMRCDLTQGAARVRRRKGGRCTAMSTGTDIEKLAVSAGMRMTEQRRVIAQVLTQSDDHPDVEEVHRRSVLKMPVSRLPRLPNCSPV